MNAPNEAPHNWESLNEERFFLLCESIYIFSKMNLIRLFLLLNLLIFLIYKAARYLGLMAKTIFLSAPAVRFESEESWLYRQIK